MANKSKQERMNELTNAVELRLRHLYVMVLKEKNSNVFSKNNQPTFLREYLCDSFQSAFFPIRDQPATKATNILDKNTDTGQKGKNGPTESNYQKFCNDVLGKTKPKKEKDFSVLRQQSEHLEKKLATQKDKFQRKMEIIHSDIGESFIEILSRNAPWLKKPMDGLQPIPLLESDFYKLLTVATVISLNLNTNTRQEKTNDQVDQLCYHFLFTDIEPEVLPDFSLKDIFDTLLQGRTPGAVPTPGPEKFVPTKMDQVNDLDCLRILLSGIPIAYTLIPSEEASGSTDKTYADETQILQNDATQYEIRNLTGFYEKYKNRQSLDDLWRSMSAALRKNLCAFDQFYRSVVADIDNESIKNKALEAVRRGQLNDEDSKKIKNRFVDMLSKCAWVENICSAFWSGHDVKETLGKANVDIFDCITAFVLIAVYCLKTKPGGPNDAIPEKRENFKKALIQKIKEVFFTDLQTRIQQVNNNLQLASNNLQQLIPELKDKDIEEALLEALVVSLGDVRRVLELLGGLVNDNQKIPAESKNLLINYATSMFNPNMKLEESDKDKAKSKLLTPDPNSPKGGK